MKTTEFQLPLGKQAVAFLRAWEPDATAPRGVLQIVHGMTEHGGRYARFAQAATDAGFAVYAQDLPGHGRTARAPDEYGQLADHQGWHQALLSLRSVQHEIADRHPGRPIFMYGYSMGGFLLQDFITRHGHALAGAVLSGSTAKTGASRSLGLGLMRLEALWAGESHPSQLAAALTFRTYNRRFKPARTPFDWLSSDTEAVDEFVADPRCGFVPSCGLWIELLHNIGRLGDPKRQSRLPKQLPLLLMAGEQDTVCEGAEGPRSLEQRYRAAGLSDIELRVYDNARHDLLHEHCHAEVTRDVIDWMAHRCPV